MKAYITLEGLIELGQFDHTEGAEPSYLITEYWFIVG